MHGLEREAGEVLKALNSTSLVFVLLINRFLTPEFCIYNIFHAMDEKIERVSYSSK